MRSILILLATCLVASAAPGDSAGAVLITPTGAHLSVNLIRAECPYTGHTSCTAVDGRTIWLEPRLGSLYRPILVHEEAHALSGQGLVSAAVRARFMQLGGYTGDWYADRGPSLAGDPTSLEELFAEAYSYCGTTPRADYRYDEPFGEYGWDPPRKQRVQTCDAFYRRLR